MNLSHCLSKASTLFSEKLISTAPLCNSVQEDCSFRVNYSFGSEECVDVNIQESLLECFFFFFLVGMMAQRYSVAMRTIKTLAVLNRQSCSTFIKLVKQY